VNVQIQELLGRGRGVVDRRAHPGLRGAFDWALKKGELVAVLPGVYAAPAEAEALATRARAARLRDPECVVVRESAAFLMGWGEVTPPRDLRVASMKLRSGWGIRVERRRVPRRLTRRLDGIVITSRALTALDLTDARGPDAIDDALRRRVALDELNLAVELVPHRRGHASRRRWLAQSTGRPFSAAERRAQGSLRDAGVTGWVGNLEFCDDDGQVVAIGDLVFEHLHLVIEIDGQGHLRPDQVLHDRARDLWLGARGWSVHRIGADVTLDGARFVGIVRALVRARESVLGAGVGPVPGARGRAEAGRVDRAAAAMPGRRRRRPANTAIRHSTDAAASAHAWKAE
jgi:Protein of unknown function (DUF559)